MAISDKHLPLKIYFSLSLPDPAFILRSSSLHIMLLTTSDISSFLTLINFRVIDVFQRKL